MPSPFDRFHHRIDQFATAKDYKRPKQGPRKGIKRATEQHAEELKRSLAAAWADAAGLIASRDGALGDAGTYLDFETLPNALSRPKLEKGASGWPVLTGRLMASRAAPCLCLTRHAVFSILNWTNIATNEA
jgi:hypothetical protein